MGDCAYGRNLLVSGEHTMRTLMVIGAIAGCSAVAGAQLNLGTFEGQWDNTTFGSTGAAFMLVESLGGADLSITVDLDGFVFGMGDPDPFTITGTVGAGGFVADPFGDPLFGTMSGGVDLAGNVAIDLAGAGAGAFDLVTLRGTAAGDLVHIEYEIFEFVGAGPFAVGVLHLDRVIPTPGTLALLGIGGVVMTRRKR